MKWRYIKKYQLFFLGILTFLIFTIGILNITLNYVKTSRKWELSKLEEQVKTGLGQLQFYFKNLCSNLLRIEKYLANSNMKVNEELYRYFDFIKGVHPDSILAIFVLDANGNTIANTNPNLVKLNFQESKYFKNIQQVMINKVYLSEVINLSDLSQHTAKASKSFKDPMNSGFLLYTGVYSKGELKGGLFFVLRSEPFSNRYSAAVTKLISGCGFILQKDGRILFHRRVECRGKYLSELPENCNLFKFNNLIEKSGGKILGQYMMVTSKISLENQDWTAGILTTKSKLAQKTLTLIYTLGGLVLLFGIIIFSLVVTLVKLGQAKKDLQKAYEEREELERIINYSPAVVFLWCATEGWPVEFVSDNVQQFGYSPEDFYSGRVFFADIIHPDDLKHVTKEIIHYSRKGYENFVQEYRIITKTGKICWVDDRTWIRRNSNGVITHYQGIILNITDRKKAEEELRKYRKHLEELVKERTADLESFTYTVSHDLRAPLRAMEGFSHALLEDYASQLDSDGQEYARRIVTASQRLGQMIQDLLDYSRIGRTELKLEKVELGEVVKDALAQLETKIKEKNADIKLKGHFPQIIGHHATLVQVMVNIISNAIKFVAPEVKPCVRIWAEDDKEKVKLCVEDNGIGIAPEHQERIFHTFERLHGIETYPGTGIGLAIVKKGIERMDGSVGVESSLGKGSKFWIEISKSN